MTGNAVPVDLSGVQRRLQLGVVALGFLGTLLLGMGQLDYTLPAVVLAAAVCSLIVTDFNGWFRLNGVVANMAALVAVAMSLHRFRVEDSASQLLAIADLLVYLQIVLFFQQKTARIFWQLIMLSVLQVVVAAALNLSVMFGLLLVVYLLVGLYVLSLLFILRETLAYDGLAVAAALRDAGSRGTPRGRAAGLSKTTFRSAVVGDLPRSVLGRPLARNIALVAVLTLLISQVVFFTIPRYRQAPWQLPSVVPIRSVGFSEEVQLGHLGMIAQDPEVVMQVKFVDTQTEQPLRIQGEPLFHGGVLTRYEIEKRSWSQPRRGPGEIQKLPSHDPADQLVRQEITLEARDRPTLFSVFPPVELGDRNVQIDPQTHKLIHTDYTSRSNNRSPYVVGTAGLRDGRPLEIQPLMPGERVTRRNTKTQHKDGNQAKGEIREKLPKLTALAERLIAEAALPADDRLGQARVLSEHFSASGEYEYTLDGPEREGDPVEDFISNNRRGHCEYFATALTLMLQSRGIPARMVVGYKGGEWNSFGEYSTVRQLHAHAWVQVFLEPEHLPPELQQDERYTKHQGGGGWLTLDPTPGGSDVDLSSTAATIWDHAKQFLDYTQVMWTKYFVDMTSKRQAEVVYDMARDRAQWVMAIVSSPAETDDSQNQPGWAARLLNWLRDNWLSLWGMVVLSLLLCLVVLIAYAARWCFRRLRVCWRCLADRASRRASPTIEFYRRLERILAREGIRRDAGQTQREFAMAAGGQMAESAALRPLAALPRRIVDIFYQVRFGGRSLDSRQTETLERTLAQLQHGLRRRKDEG